MTIKNTGIETIDDILHIMEHQPDFEDWGIYGHVNTKTEGDYVLFNYSAEAQYENRWNNFELMSRGLIIDRKRLKVMARPFDKFFNWGERGRITDSPIDYVMEKMDGSLGICWFDPTFEWLGEIGNWRITTRGSFESEQAQWATAFLHANYGHRLQFLNSDATYLFEIIYPENRIVVDYRGESDLFLIAIRIKTNGFILSREIVQTTALNIGAPLPVMNTFRYVDDLISIVKGFKGVEREGFVAVMQDGSRWKFKSEDYLRIHKVISTFSFKNTLAAMANNSLDEWLESVPDEFLGDIRKWRDAIAQEIQKLDKRIINAWDKLRSVTNKPRKEFATRVQSEYPDLAPYLFRVLDDKPIWDVIFKKHDFSHLENLDD